MPVSGLLPTSNEKPRFRDKLRKGFHGVRDSLLQRGKVPSGAAPSSRTSSPAGPTQLSNGDSSARPTAIVADLDDPSTAASLNGVNGDHAVLDTSPVDPIPPSASSLPSTNACSAPSQETPEPSIPTSDVETASPPYPSATPKERLSVTLNVLSQVLNAATAATAVFPPAQAVVGGVASGVKMAKSMVQNQLDREAVERNLKEAQRRIGKCAEMASVSEGMATMLSDLERDLKEDIGSIDDAMHESWWRRLVEGDAQETMKHYGKLSSRLSLFNSNQTQTVINTDAHVEALKKITVDLKSMTTQNSKTISEIQADVKFQSLGRITKAEYNAGPHDLRRACTPNTRSQILTDLMTWATDDTTTATANVYWLSGMAGTGKTTIAYSFCDRLRAAGLLATSYFCSRSVASSVDPRAVVPSVSYHLAAHSPGFSMGLLDVLRDPDNVDIREKVVEEQFDALILGPMRASSVVEDPKRRVLVYDGADEAGNLKEVAKLISLFLEHAEKLPFKVFISSRRDDIIKAEFGRGNPTAHSTALILHDIEKSLVQADIRVYMSSRLGHLYSTLPPGTIDTLVERSGTLFVYASVLCSFLDHTSPSKVKRRLKAVLDEVPAPTDGTMARPHDVLDRVYRQILSGVEDNRVSWPVLLVILTAPNPLGVVEIAGILGWEEEDRVEEVVGGLHAVLAGSDLGGRAVTIFHSSFRDFLCDTSRGGKFCARIADHHEMLLMRSLQLMKGGLLANGLCEGATEDTPRSAVEPQVSDELAYACMSWIEHLLGLSAEQVVVHEKKLRVFFDRLILRWVECLAWLGHLREGVSSLRRAELSTAIPSEFCLAFMDARRFTLQSFEAIRDYPLEVYHSALVWLPKTSRLRNRFESEFHKADWRVTRGLPVSWDACESVLTGHVDRVQSVDVSRDGRWIVSGSDDGTVRIWNVETGEEERMFVGHEEVDPVLSVCFSPDAHGRRVVSGSDDGTVRIWNRETALEERKLGRHVGSVRCVAFSFDGRRVVSASDDKTVRVWSVHVERGEEERRLEGHAETVWSVCFSPDGRRVVSGLSDQTVRIWNLETGLEEEKLEGHSHSVHSVSFSPDGNRIVSASADNTLRIWDSETGEEERKLEGHSDWVMSASFSPDGRRVVSASDDTTVRVWNVETGQEERRLEGHSAWVRAVVFSPDGRRVVSGSRDKTIRIWNIEIGQDEEERENSEGHVHPVQSVSLSPDGERAASGSRDNTVRIWNVEMGQEEMVLEGHSDWVQSVSFSPDGCRVVSGSHDQTVRIWNVDSDIGKEEKKLEGHSDTVWSVCFSPDGKKVVSGSDDGTARIWDAEMGEEEKRLDSGGDSYLMRSLSFSSDGRTVVSLSRARKVRKMWNIETGEEERGNGLLTSAGPAVLDRIAIKDGSLRSRSSQLWIPPEFRNYSCAATSPNAVCFGYDDGRVLIARYLGV